MGLSEQLKGEYVIYGAPSDSSASRTVYSSPDHADLSNFSSIIRITCEELTGRFSGKQSELARAVAFLDRMFFVKNRTYFDALKQRIAYHKSIMGRAYLGRHIPAQYVTYKKLLDDNKSYHTRVILPSKVKNGENLETICYIPETFFSVRETFLTDFFCAELADQLHKRIVVIDHRVLSSDVTLTDMVQDAKVAVLKVASLFGENDIHLMGYGMGAFMATMTLHEIEAKHLKTSIKSLTLLDAFTDFKHIANDKMAASQDSLMGRQYFRGLKQYLSTGNNAERNTLPLEFSEALKALKSSKKSEIKSLRLPSSMFRPDYQEQVIMAAVVSDDNNDEEPHQALGHLALWSSSPIIKYLVTKRLAQQFPESLVQSARAAISTGSSTASSSASFFSEVPSSELSDDNTVTTNFENTQ